MTRRTQFHITSKQEKTIKEWIKKLERAVPKKELEEGKRDREERLKFFKEILKKENLEKMDELVFSKIISNLWATIWGNKDYKIQMLLKDNGLENLRKYFLELLYGNQPIEQRFDKILKQIKGLGPASITEILCYFDPENFGIWNDKARKALRMLGFEEELPLNKYHISGKEYERFNQILKMIQNVLKNSKYYSGNLLAVDYFLYDVWYYSSRGIFEEKEQFDYDHDEIKEYLEQIGSWLGFESRTEVPLVSGKRVDVVWYAKIANLGSIAYVFEVQKKGSIDSLVLNLQKALRHHTVQKVVAVSDERQLEKIKKFVEDLSEDFRKRLLFWNVKDVVRVYENLSEVARILEELNLVEKEF